MLKSQCFGKGRSAVTKHQKFQKSQISSKPLLMGPWIDFGCHWTSFGRYGLPEKSIFARKGGGVLFHEFLGGNRFGTFEDWAAKMAKFGTCRGRFDPFNHIWGPSMYSAIFPTHFQLFRNILVFLIGSLSPPRPVAWSWPNLWSQGWGGGSYLMVLRAGGPYDP